MIDWKKNNFKGGILCTYDLILNQWDMMKYNYDIKWYNKKIEERKSVFNNDILSFQEIAKTIENNNKNKNKNKKNIKKLIK